MISISRDSYVSVPAMAQYHITPKLYAEAGPEVSLALHGVTKINNTEYVSSLRVGIDYTFKQK